LAAAFTLERVSPNPARFDLKKCTAINGDWIRTLPADVLAERIVPYLAEALVIATPPTPEQQAILAAAVPLVQERMETLKQSVGMLAFLLIPQERFFIDPADASAVLTPDSAPVLVASIDALEALEEWTAGAIEVALRAALVDGLGLKPKVAFGPVRVAITGRRVSPPLFESMAILGRPVTLLRLEEARGGL
jgi:glutamyl-tRNA synthetase